MEQGENIFIFRKFMLDDDEEEIDKCHRAAVDKLQTLYPGKQIIDYDQFTIGIETDSYYSETGIDTYELGTVDWEIPAIKNTRDGEVITFRAD
ncbi:MAG: hypothetical protein MJZ41_02210 [Bacteroidaceae bacterium]|nr:hypothetical protein [Bacteroidaceae bacterium]